MLRMHGYLHADFAGTNWGFRWEMLSDRKLSGLGLPGNPVRPKTIGFGVSLGNWGLAGTENRNEALF